MHYSENKMTVIEPFLNNGKALMTTRYVRMMTNAFIKSLFKLKSLKMHPLIQPLVKIYNKSAIDGFK